MVSMKEMWSAEEHRSRWIDCARELGCVAVYDALPELRQVK
jgi:hypothetical protein